MNKLFLIQSFIAAVEEGTFTAAAEKLGKTKALISTQIQQLESHLQIKLFTRSTRQIVLTDHGLDYYHGCKALLEQWEALEMGLCEQLDAVSGLLRITAPLHFGQKKICPMTSEFLKQYPDVSFDIDLCDRQVDLIQEGYDFAFRIGILEDSRLIAIPLQTFEMVVCASENYLQSHPKLKSPSDLTHHACIVDTQHKDQNKWQFQHKSKNQKIKVNPIFSVNNAYTAASIAADGLGVTKIPLFAAEEFLKNGQLTRVLDDYCYEPHTLYLIYPDKKYPSRKADMFKQYIKDQFS